MKVGGWIQFSKSHGDFFKTAVFDEPQSLRTGKGTQKGAAAFLLSQSATYRLGLTATPIYNYGVEMWNVMQFIDDAVPGAWTDFEREWVTIVNPDAVDTSGTRRPSGLTCVSSTRSSAG